MKISLLIIDHCWNCKKRVLAVKSWEIVGHDSRGGYGWDIDQVDTTYLRHKVGRDCIIEPEYHPNPKVEKASKEMEDYLKSPRLGIGQSIIDPETCPHKEGYEGANDGATNCICSRCGALINNTPFGKVLLLKDARDRFPEAKDLKVEKWDEDNGK
jgi:hypothetical protein